MKAFWNRLSIRYKILSIGFMIILLFVLTLVVYILPSFNTIMIDLKKEKLVNITDVALGTVTTAYQAYTSGRMTEEEAKRSAIDNIRNMRYGPEGKDYLWINDFHPTMIMHPFNPDLDGTDLTDKMDPHGKRLFVEMARVCSENDHGFVDYMWQWKDRKDMVVPKISYVRAFKPWGWIVGTGIYIEDVRAEVRAITFRILMVILLIAGVCGLAFFLYTGSIISRIRSVGGSIERIREGELSVDVDVVSGDELGDMMKNFKSFTERLKEIILRVKDVASQLAASSTQMSGTADSLSTNSQGQAATTEEITATIEEISGSMENISDNAREQYENLNLLMRHLNDLSSEIREMGERVKEAQGITDDISTRAAAGEKSLRDMTENMKKIQDSTREMTNITGIINDISDRINLLSLNASIEAARAGDAGKGFAVVAEEISKLADQTASSIKDIGGLIRENDSEIETFIGNVSGTVSVLSGIIGSVSAISSRMDDLYAGMEKQLATNNEVNREAETVRGRADEIRTATEEQKIATSEIVKSITNISVMTQSTASGSQELAGNAEMISQMAVELRSRVEYFRD